MSLQPPIRSRSRQGSQDKWLGVIGRAIHAAEAAELELSRMGGSSPAAQRKESGSYYTPSDVAAHFWDLFFRHHRINDLTSLLAFVSSSDFVEPSAGSGMFVFSFLRKAALLGATAKNLSAMRFHVVDVNLAALRFFSESTREIEKASGIKFTGIRLAQNDFLEWLKTSNVANAIFVGNPPFITNPRGARWRNSFADFTEAMLSYPSTRGISLILPLSLCFSRDYADLRDRIRSAGMGVSASNYDNIPDCLFKVGKPDSTNTNRANSQRCTILNMGGPNPVLREASALLRWTAAERAIVLSNIPTFSDFDDGDSSGQIPRPGSERLCAYMRGMQGARPLGTFLSKIGRAALAVGSVARNFIGIRDVKTLGPGCIPIRTRTDLDRWTVFQALSSTLFYDYWRTYGDGFHVTVDLIERFPISDDLANHFKRNQHLAKKVWDNRKIYAKVKLNSGKVIRSYDFREAFE
jgi:hypothetical protein